MNTYDGKYVIRQIKFTVDAEVERYEVTWDWLLRPSGQQGRGTSLLKKWVDSLTPHLQADCVHEAALYTNRKASAEIALLMSGDRIGFDSITDTAIRSEIITQVGSEEAARAFFHEFRFRVDCPEPGTLEASLKSRFLSLHGDGLGWLNLMSEIRVWAKYKSRPAPSGEITIQVLRHAARWHRLRELPQGFELPLDYAVSRRDFHTDFLDAVRNRGRSCFVLWGSLGIGKSTYLSYRVAALKDGNIPVIRHHYFLSMTDRSGDRFSHGIVAESLMQQIQARHPEALGTMAPRNPQPEQCGEWLSTCGQYYASQNVPFVVVIDGLDRVVPTSLTLLANSLRQPLAA